MATREIAKRQPQYTDPEIDPELIPIPDQATLGGRSVAKLRVLWDRRKLLFRWFVIGVVGSLILAFIIPIRYTATTRLMPPDQAGQGIASMFAALGKSSE